MIETDKTLNLSIKSTMNTDDCIFSCRRRDLRSAMRVVYTMLKSMPRSAETEKLGQDFAYTINSMCWKPLETIEDPPISQQKKAEESVFLEIDTDDQTLDKLDMESFRSHIAEYMRTGGISVARNVVEDFVTFTQPQGGSEDGDVEQLRGLDELFDPTIQQFDVWEDDSQPKAEAIASRVKPKRSNSVPKRQCEARIWGKLHDGSERCSKPAGPTGLCSVHAYQEAECAIPCKVSDDGSKRVGLYMGRITQFQEDVDEPNLPPYMDSNGYVRIYWNSQKMREHIRDALQQGSCTIPLSGLGSKIPKDLHQIILSSRVEQDMGSVYSVDFRNPDTTHVDIELIRKRLENMSLTTKHLILIGASVPVVTHLVETGFADTAIKNLEVLELTHGALKTEWYSEDLELLVKFCDSLNINLARGRLCYPNGDMPLKDGFPNDGLYYNIWSIHILDFQSTEGKIAQVKFPNHICSGYNNIDWNDVGEWKEFVNNQFNTAAQSYYDHANAAACQKATFWCAANYTQQEWGNENYVIIEE